MAFVVLASCQIDSTTPLPITLPPSDGNVEVYVLDADSRVPIPDVAVDIRPDECVVTPCPDAPDAVTDERGHVSIDLPTGWFLTQAHLPFDRYPLDCQIDEVTNRVFTCEAWPRSSLRVADTDAAVRVAMGAPGVAAHARIPLLIRGTGRTWQVSFGEPPDNVTVQIDAVTATTTIVCDDE